MRARTPIVAYVIGHQRHNWRARPLSTISAPTGRRPSDRTWPLWARVFIEYGQQRVRDPYALLLTSPRGADINEQMPPRWCLFRLRLLAQTTAVQRDVRLRLLHACVPWRHSRDFITRYFTALLVRLEDSGGVASGPAANQEHLVWARRVKDAGEGAYSLRSARTGDSLYQSHTQY